MKRKTFLAGAAAATLLAAPAFAQSESGSDMAPQWEEDPSAVIIEQEQTETKTTSARAPGDNRGVDVMLGGGVEGYTGDFRGEVNPGFGWSVVARGQPTKIVGFELGYSGALNELDADITGGSQGATGGADIVRNGGHAAVNVAAPTPVVQPYVMGGVGIDWYTFRGFDGELGFNDDTSGSVPVGVGLRTGFSGLTADLRFHYDMLFDDEFSSLDTGAADGRYAGLLQIGGHF